MIQIAASSLQVLQIAGVDVSGNSMTSEIVVGPERVELSTFGLAVQYSDQIDLRTPS